jgi:glycosyltransferase involved in cell wall biosynthesis
VEALACGTVPIVSDIPPNLELIRHGENGLVVAGDDPNEVAEAVLRSVRDAAFRRAALFANAALTKESFDVRRNTAGILRFAGLSDLASARVVAEDGDVLQSGDQR